MKKYFCVSDVHSFLTPLLEALNEKGFDKDNPDHILVVLGDLFDRGDETVELYNFVRGLPDDRFIYIRGNHEDLLFQCFYSIEDNETLGYHHISNGTVKTIMAFCGIDYRDDYVTRFSYDPYYPLRGNALDKLPEVLEYINKKCVDYVEIGDFILVHGWIPYKKYPWGFDENWRSGDWYQARWENGMDAWKHGIVERNKTIVCGHWHCSWGWSHIRQDRQEFPQKNKKDWLKSFEPFVDDGIIAIDACTAYSGKVNCIVIEVEEE